MNRPKRIELKPIRFPSHWGNSLVHRTFVADSRDYAKRMLVPLCYGRFLGPDQYIVTDDPVTCVICLGTDLEGILPTAQDMLEGHEADLRRRY